MSALRTGVQVNASNTVLPGIREEDEVIYLLRVVRRHRYPTVNLLFWRRTASLCSLIESVHPMCTRDPNNYYVRHNSCTTRHTRPMMHCRPPVVRLLVVTGSVCFLVPDAMDLRELKMTPAVTHVCLLMDERSLEYVKGRRTCGEQKSDHIHRTAAVSWIVGLESITLQIDDARRRARGVRRTEQRVLHVVAQRCLYKKSFGNDSRPLAARNGF
ncbi:hypothetical protein CBL_11442 [Carabus blaptoides fortunei]